jgi:hypothetical protein
MVRFRSSLIAPVLCVALSHVARGESSIPGERIVEATIGNHGTLLVRYSDSDLGRLTVETRAENGVVKTYQWRGAERTLTIRIADKQETFDAQSSPDGYAVALRKVRDLVAYAAGPERYEWLVFGSDVVVPELNLIIARIGQELGAPSSEDVNCQLLVEAQGSEPLILSGGALGDLGAYSKAISKVWVKKGYTLVLVSNPLFDTEHDVKLVRVLGEERRSTTELPRTEYDPAFSDLVEGSEGSTYSLKGTSIEGAVQSIICRPDLRS